MNDLIKLFTEYSLGSIIVFLMLILSSVFGVYNVFTKATSLLETYRIKRNSVENRDKEINNAIKQVEDLVNTQIERINKIEAKIDELEKSIKVINENLNDEIIVTVIATGFDKTSNTVEATSDPVFVNQNPTPRRREHNSMNYVSTPHITETLDLDDDNSSASSNGDFDLPPFLRDRNY